MEPKNTIEPGALVQRIKGFNKYRSKTGIVIRTFYSTTTWIDGKKEPLHICEVLWADKTLMEEPIWKIEKVA